MSASALTEMQDFNVESLLGTFVDGISREDLDAVHNFAAQEEPADHWLRSGKLSYEQRLFLGAAAMMALRSPLSTPYKCSVFMRHAAEKLARGN